MSLTKSHPLDFELTHPIRSEHTPIAPAVYLDPVTGLPEGRSLPVLLDKRLEAEKLQPTNRMLALILVDLDRFRTINRCMGHRTGDALLAEAASRLKEKLPEGAELYRYCADEFYIVVPHVEQLAGLYDQTRRLLSAVKCPFHYNGREITVDASIGISLYPNDGMNADSLMVHAGVAMRRVKEKGGGFFQLFHPEMDKDAFRSFDVEAGLRRAILENQLTLHYQPLVHLETGRITGVEALVRWNHPEWGETSPARFIPIAEETGLIIPTGRWVLEEACRQYAEWQKLGYGGFDLSVNVSVAQLLYPGFTQHLEETVRNRAMDPSCLKLEITESIALNNSAYMLETLKRLQEFGVKIAVDDFGTGYSSISCLKRFPVHTLKIDRSLVQDADQDENSGAIVTALIAMARRMGISSLAEGVETEAQHEFLKRQGCDEAQGFYYSVPITAGALTDLLRSIQSQHT